MLTLKELTPDEFCLAFLTALGAKGTNVIDLRSSHTTRGFAAALAALDDTINTIQQSKSATRKQAIALLKTRSYLSPSPIGAFDRFETCLRGLQTSVMSSDNPELRDMHSEITEPFASNDLEKTYDQNVRQLARDAADRFRAAVSAG